MSSFPSAPTPPPPEYPSPPKRSTMMIVLIVVIVVAAAGIGGLFYYWYEPGHFLNPYRVSVSQVTWTVNGQTVKTVSGFTVFAGTYVSTGLQLTCLPASGVSQSCSSGTVTIPTPGFRFVSSNAPVNWSSGTSGVGTTVTIGVQFQTPTGSSYSGPMTIALVGTSTDVSS